MVASFKCEHFYKIKYRVKSCWPTTYITTWEYQGRDNSKLAHNGYDDPRKTLKSKKDEWVLGSYLCNCEWDIHVKIVGSEDFWEISFFVELADSGKTRYRNIGCHVHLWCQGLCVERPQRWSASIGRGVGSGVEHLKKSSREKWLYSVKTAEGSRLVRIYFIDSK